MDNDGKKNDDLEVGALDPAPPGWVIIAIAVLLAVSCYFAYAPLPS